MGRSPGVGNSNPLQYSCLEKSTNRGAWQAAVQGVAKSRTPLSDFHFLNQIKTSIFIPSKCFPGGTVIKDLSANSGDMGSIPGWGRSPGVGNGNSLQYSCLENCMDKGTRHATVCKVRKELDRLSDNQLEKAMAPHSSTLAWKIPWTEEPGRLQSMGSLRVGHD